jgi:hypothetical protein
MNGKLAGLLGAIAGLATVGTAQASVRPATDPAAQPSSYADLLAPIPDAAQALKADNASRAAIGGIEDVQYYYYYGPPYYYYHHHHHHHHHNHHHHR